MDRVINVQVTGCAVRKDSKNAGVQGEANVTTLRIMFSPEWKDLAKKIIWLDAGGENPVARILTTETDGAFETTIPGEAMTKVGQCCFTIQGVKDSIVAMAVTEHLNVLPNDSYGMEPGNAADPTPSVADQINGKVSALAETVAELGKAAVHPVGKTEEMTDPVGKDENGELWAKPSGGSKGPKGDPGEKGEKGDTGPKGDQGPGAEVYYINLAGAYPSYTCGVSMDEIAAAYNAGKVVRCRCVVGDFLADLPLFLPISSAKTWIFSGSGGLPGLGIATQSLSVAIINGSVMAEDTTLAKKEDIPEIPNALKNPNALTIKIGSTSVVYDGSSAKTVTIDDGTEVSY